MLLDMLLREYGREKGSNMYCVYRHTAPNGKMYIGLTCRKPELRYGYGHGYKKCVYFYKAIQKYGWDNIKHEVLFENLTYEDAVRIEEVLIGLFRTTDERYGYNISPKSLGEGRLADETKEKISAGLYKFYEEHPERRCKPEHCFTPEAIEKRRQSMINFQHTDETKEYLREVHRKDMKAIVQLDKEGNVLNTFESSKAAIRYLNKPRECANHIAQCCKGLSKTAYGFVWRYVT